MRIILRLVIFLFCTPLIAQNFSNDWINYSQSYYKFPITENGLYRINYQALVDAGIAVNNLNPQNLQLFARGKEIPIYINGENDGVFNITDYIEFYAEGNDGWLDTALYNGAENQPNPYYSLINDTLNYFLSWNSSTNNQRYQEENAIDFSNYFQSSFVWQENVQFFSNAYYDGEFSRQGTDPEYVPSEGWMDNALNIGATFNKTLATPSRYSAGPFAEFEIQFVGASNFSGVNDGDHHVRISIGKQQIDHIYEGYDLVNIKRSFSPSEIFGGNNVVRFQSIDDRGSDVDRTALAFMKITYPRTMSFSNNSYLEFQLDNAQNQDAQYLEILFFRGGNSPVLYDLTNRKKMRIVQTLSNYKTIVPNGSGRKRCVIAAETEIKSINSLKAVNADAKFVDYFSQQLDTSFLIITQEQLIPDASFYGAYRRSTGLEPLIVDVEQLYMQFAFGIDKHPLAIRNFIDAITAKGQYPLSHVFLMGKSVAAKAHRKSSSGYIRNLVPTMGNPPADNLLLAGLNGSILEPIVPLGRLSAKNGNDIDLYLDKLKEYESAPSAKWMKKAIHFAGGKSIRETDLHEGYLNGYAQSFESSPSGGQTLLFRKNTSSPFQISLSDSIRTLINDGVSLLTFFGHSTANAGFDISIDSPDKLDNQGRYHVLFANSCFAGNTHQNGAISTSEQYVLERNKGAIAFIASGNLGFSSSLNTYSTEFYKNLANENYGKSLAENMQATVRNIQSSSTPTALRRICLEMTLQGDPAIVMNAHQNADFQVDNQSVNVFPTDVTTDLDSFKVTISISNLGQAIDDSVVVQLIRKFPNPGINDSIVFRKVRPIPFEESIEFTFPINLNTDIGNNQFTFLVDPLGSIEELSELNNRIDFNILVRSGEVIPVYPYNYSIVGQQSPILKASTAFAFENEKSYRFELDTSLAFESPLKTSNDILSSGGVIEWQAPLLQNMEDSAVFFWRVSQIPESGENFNWRTSSFQYIPGESGWSQDHFDQYNRNNFLFIEQVESRQQLDFSDNIKELLVRTKGSPEVIDRNKILYAIDADIRERASCFSIPAFLIAVLDSLTLESWQSAEVDYGQANFSERWCFPNRERSEAIFNFNAGDSLQLFRMRDFLNNRIPDGSYVVAYNYLNIDFSYINNLDSSILKAFENLGSSALKSIPNNYPFILSAKKGDPSTIAEKVGTSASDEIELKRILITSSPFGEMTSVNIGPSSDFNRLSYQFYSLENNSKDSLIVDLIGTNQSGQKMNLLSSQKKSLDTTLSGLFDNSIYKDLQLKFTAFDDLNQTPPQLRRWQINYNELPDAALAPNLSFKVNKDSLQQGENFEFEVSITNNSPIDMDSLSVGLKVLNAQLSLSDIGISKLSPLVGNGTLVFKASIPTNNLLGINTLLIEVNPEQDQDEQHYFNNLGQYSFYVSDDRINPLLDVTFDGRHIVNREIISTNPLINISLKDNNKHLAIDDSSSFNLFLTYPDGVEELLDFGIQSDYELNFIPASLPDNIARAVYSPEFNQDGVYRLKIQAADKSGNSSGNKDYQVDFEVVTNSSVTHLLNYPNPFSTSTQFVFTLTGSELPDQIQIQIMTITGKVVREINQDEIGPIHIGTNITEFRWDGKDDFGDQLANGVYLYRVKMRIKGSNVEQRASEADQFFTKDFGKMYLLR